MYNQLIHFFKIPRPLWAQPSTLMPPITMLDVDHGKNFRVENTR